MVEVTAPDGTKSLWAAAVAPSAAVEAVKKMITPDHIATLSSQRLPIGPQTEGIPGPSAENRTMSASALVLPAVTAL